MDVHTSYLVCGEVRSGSSLLCEALKNTGLAGRPEEYFWHGMENDQFFEGWELDDYGEYVRRVVEATATANGVFGAKMMGGYLRAFLERVGQSPAFAGQDVAAAAMMAALFPNLKHVWLTRRNKVRQAVSWWMAIQTNQWSSEQAYRPEREPEYKFEAIDHLVDELVVREAAMQEYFDVCGVKPLVCVYEDFVDAYEETARMILDFLGVQAPGALVFGERRLKKQANARSEEWVQRYREEKQAGWWTKFW